MLKKLKQLLSLNRVKLTWLAISFLMTCWMVYEQAQGSPWQFIGLLLLAVTMMPAAMTEWEPLPAARSAGPEEI